MLKTKFAHFPFVNQQLSHLKMSAFHWVTNHMDMGYGVDVKLRKREQREHTYKVLKEWPRTKFCIILSTACILELNSGTTNNINVVHSKSTKNLVEGLAQYWKKDWNGMDHLMNFQMKYPPIYHTSFLLAWRHLKEN